MTILKECAKHYPGHAGASWKTLLNMAPGSTPDEQAASLVAHLASLETSGYITGLFLRQSIDGYLACNHAFNITLEGLRAAGEDVLEARACAIQSAILARLELLQDISKAQKFRFFEEIKKLPFEALKHLQDAGLDALLDFLKNRI